MKVIGDGAVHFYEAKDECPHIPSEEESWQESVVVTSWDTSQEVYIFLRIAQMPNRAGGQATTWINIWTPEGFYKHTDDSIPLGEDDVTENSISIGKGLCTYAYNGDHYWSVRDGQVSVDLSFVDDYSGIGFLPANAGSLVNESARNHIEATGLISGVVTIGEKTYEVNGIGWRDHSWGPRNWMGFRSHRFFVAMFGQDLKVFAISFVGADGNLAKHGVVIRDDTIEGIDDFSIIAYMDEDGVSNRGGRVNLPLDGKEHTIEFELLNKSAISMVYGLPCVDGMCRVTMGDRVGVGLSETSSRPQGGDERPSVFPSSWGVIENGFFKN